MFLPYIDFLNALFSFELCTVGREQIDEQCERPVRDVSQRNVTWSFDSNRAEGPAGAECFHHGIDSAQILRF